MHAFLPCRDPVHTHIYQYKHTYMHAFAHYCNHVHILTSIRRVPLPSATFIPKALAYTRPSHEQHFQPQMREKQKESGNAKWNGIGNMAIFWCTAQADKWRRLRWDQRQFASCADLVGWSQIFLQLFLHTFQRRVSFPPLPYLRRSEVYMYMRMMTTYTILWQQGSPPVRYKKAFSTRKLHYTSKRSSSHSPCRSE